MLPRLALLVCRLVISTVVLFDTTAMLMMDEAERTPSLVSAASASAAAAAASSSTAAVATTATATSPVSRGGGRSMLSGAAGAGAGAGAEGREGTSSSAALVFPGMYTALFASTSTRNAIQHWSQHQGYDVIQIVDVEAPLNDHNNNTTTTTAGVAGAAVAAHLLIQTEAEYTAITSHIRVAATRTRTRRSTTRAMGSMGEDDALHVLPQQLTYNATLTERWIQPKLRITEQFQERQQRQRQRRVVEENNNNKTKPNEKNQDTAPGRNLPGLMRKSAVLEPLAAPEESNYSKMAAPYECYANYAGMMTWIEQFIDTYGHNQSEWIDVEWLDIGDSYLKTQYMMAATPPSQQSQPHSEPGSLAEKLAQLAHGTTSTVTSMNHSENYDDNTRGHDIKVLTITGKTKQTTTTNTAAVTPKQGMFPNNSGMSSLAALAALEGFESPSATNSPEDTTKTNQKAPLILISSTHAREYTPPELVRRWLEEFILHQVLEKHDPDAVSILDTTKIHWIPYLNPDGRIEAETTAPFRRKNMNPHSSSSSASSTSTRQEAARECGSPSYGVDLNRNFPFEWGKEDGSSSRPCGPDTHGIAPGSEPETRAVINYLTNTNDKGEEQQYHVFPRLQQQQEENALNSGGTDFSIRHVPGQSVENSSTRWKGYTPQTTQGVFVDIHSFGQVYIYPWGNLQYALNPNDRSYRSIVGQLQHLTGLTAKQAGPDHYGVASGCTDDWAYGALGTISMTWELGTKFHEPCDDFEKEYQKHFPALVHLAKIAHQPYLLGLGPILQSVSLSSSSIPSKINTDQQIDDTNTLVFHYNPENNDLIRMESKRNNIDNDGEDINEVSISVRIEFPSMLNPTMPAITFDDGTTMKPQVSKITQTTTSSTTTNDKDDEERLIPSQTIQKIRVHYKQNPLLLSSLSITEDSNDRNHDFWDLNFNKVEEDDADENDYYFYPASSSSSSATTYISSISKDQFWTAFDNDPANNTEDNGTRILYVQAMDGNGFWGPVTATSLHVVLLEQEEEGQEQEQSRGDSAEATLVPPIIPSTSPGMTATSTPTRGSISSPSSSRLPSPSAVTTPTSQEVRTGVLNKRTGVEHDRGNENENVIIESSNIDNDTIDNQKAILLSVSSSLSLDTNIGINLLVIIPYILVLFCT